MRPNDIAAMFDHEKFTAVTGKAAPTVDHRADRRRRRRFDPDGSFEASLDVQQVLGGAPGAHVTLVDIPDLSDFNIIGGLLSTSSSTEHSDDIVNSSFGGCEAAVHCPRTTAAPTTLDLLHTKRIFPQGNAEGITFVASSGDEAGLACPTSATSTGSTARHASRPASATGRQPARHRGRRRQPVTTSAPTRWSTYAGENGLGRSGNPPRSLRLGSTVTGGYWGAGGGVSRCSPSPLPGARPHGLRVAHPARRRHAGRRLPAAASPANPHCAAITPTSSRSCRRRLAA